jgi:hypothetical protein
VPVGAVPVSGGAIVAEGYLAPEVRAWLQVGASAGELLGGLERALAASGGRSAGLELGRS